MSHLRKSIHFFKIYFYVKYLKIELSLIMPDLLLSSKNTPFLTDTIRQIHSFIVNSKPNFLLISVKLS